MSKSVNNFDIWIKGTDLFLRTKLKPEAIHDLIPLKILRSANPHERCHTHNLLNI